ncbi:MAG: hypothetical protein LBF05_06665, partial [Tannerella sp.]|nr:hypothetical protein [Tannerella sp.]
MKENIKTTEPDPEPDPDPDPEEAIDRTFIVRATAPVASSVETYAYVDMSGTPPFYRWESSNVNIGLFVEGSDGDGLLNNEQVSLNSNGLKESTNVSMIHTSQTNARGFAYYPYQTSISGTILSSSLSSRQDQSTRDTVMDTSLSPNLLMIAPPSESFVLNGGNCNLFFQNIFALIQLRIIKDTQLNMLESAKSLKLYIADENDLLTPLDYALAGDYNIDLLKAPETTGYTGPQFQDHVNVITAQFSEGYNISDNLNTTTAWIVINPVEIKQNERLVVYIEGSKGSLIGVPFSIGSIERNKIYRLIVEANASNTVVADDIQATFWNKPANSFMVTKRGLYQINAKTAAGEVVKGTKVEWLWASKEDGARPSLEEVDEFVDTTTLIYNKSDDYIRFYVGGRNPFAEFKKGNVILALKNESDEIVWTWHLWITDKPDDIRYNEILWFLDRNMGALSADTMSSAVNTYGFVYQWGRKDPFIGGDGLVFYESTNDVLSVANAHTLVNSSVKWSAADRGTGHVSVAESVKYPMKFIYNSNSSSNEDPADWLSVSDTKLWFDDEKKDDGKTAYDPCPYGYRVPRKADLSILHDASNKTSPPFPVFHNRNNSNRYWVYSYSGVTTAWPTAGMREGRHAASGKWYGGQLKYSGTNNNMGYGYYWTSTPWDKYGRSVVPGASYSMTMHDTILYETTY